MTIEHQSALLAVNCSVCYVMFPIITAGYGYGAKMGSLGSAFLVRCCTFDYGALLIRFLVQSNYNL